MTTKTRFDRGITPARQNLHAALGSEDDEDLEVLGRLMVFEVGDVLVPRDWLVQQSRSLGIPEDLIPREVTPHSAYKRAMQRLVDAEHETQRINGHKTKFTLRDGDGNIRHLRADVFFPERESGEEGGRWSSHEVGRFVYDVEAQDVGMIQSSDCPPALTSAWETFKSRAASLHQSMQAHHTGDDLRLMIGYLRRDYSSTVIPYRNSGAVYFVPEGRLTDILEAMQELFEEARQYKANGMLGIDLTPLVDSEDKRKWIAQRVESTLDSMVDSVIDEAFAALDAQEETAEEIVQTLIDNLDDSTDTASQYNALLESQLGIEEILEDRAEDLKGEKRDIIEKVLDEADL